MDFQQIQQLVTLVETSQIKQLDIQDSDTQQRIRIKNAFVENAIEADNADQNLTTTPTPTAQTAQTLSQAENVITSTQVGWLQLAPDAGSANKINVGDTVAVGDVVAWVSVMDRLLPIESRKAGRVSKILGENKQAVEYGTALFELT